jgi:hypothetical protein
MATAQGGSWDPSFQFSACTPSDTARLTYTNSAGIVEEKRCKAIYVGGAGNLQVKNDAGNSVVFTGVVAGSVYPISTDTIMNALTTCTGIVALF